MKRFHGLSMIEVLFTFGILAIGLSAISMMVYKGTRLSNTAIDQNAAAMLISEAVHEIEKRHLITVSMTRKSATPLTTTPDKDGYSINPDHVGLFIETVNSNGATPSMHDTAKNAPYSLIQSGTVVLGDALNPTYLDIPDPDMKQAISTAMWPMPPAESAKTYGSSPQAPKRSEKYKKELIESGNQDVLEREYNSSYRVLYRLERHPDWHPHPVDVTTGIAAYDVKENEASIFVGIYVLTLVPYKDKVGNGKILEQLGPPVVVYLRDRKNR